MRKKLCHKFRCCERKSYMKRNNVLFIELIIAPSSELSGLCFNKHDCIWDLSFFYPINRWSIKMAAYQTRSTTKKQHQMKAICSPHRYDFIFTQPTKTPTTIRGKKLQPLEDDILYYAHLKPMHIYFFQYFSISLHLLQSHVRSHVRSIYSASLSQSQLYQIVLLSVAPPPVPNQSQKVEQPNESKLSRMQAPTSHPKFGVFAGVHLSIRWSCVIT